MGIIQGTSKSTFNPENKITREQLVTMLTRFLRILNVNTSSNSTNTLNSFTDKNNISNWAFDSLSYCVDHQIIQGAQNQLQPKEPTTVEQAITMLDRIAIEKNGLFNLMIYMRVGFYCQMIQKYITHWMELMTLNWKLTGVRYMIQKKQKMTLIIC